MPRKFSLWLCREFSFGIAWQNGCIIFIEKDIVDLYKLTVDIFAEMTYNIDTRKYLVSPMKQPPCYSGRVEVLGGFLVNLSITMTEVTKPII